MMSGDGLKAVAKATELLVELLGHKAAKEALSQKRKTIKLSDVERTGVLNSHAQSGHNQPFFMHQYWNCHFLFDRYQKVGVCPQ